jgi:hypothetical protein
MTRLAIIFSLLFVTFGFVKSWIPAAKKIPL